MNRLAPAFFDTDCTIFVDLFGEDRSIGIPLARSDEDDPNWRSRPTGEKNAKRKWLRLTECQYDETDGMCP